MGFEGHQLGEFIKGRLAFIEDYCVRVGRDPEEGKKAVEQRAITLAKDEEMATYLKEQVFGGSILSGAILPDWLDRLLLEAMTFELAGVGGRTVTATSRKSCVPFEAGRFNAHKQATSVFRILYAGKTPENWLVRSFPALYNRCYGVEAGREMVVEQNTPTSYRVITANIGLEKAGPLDCSTVIGYLFGSLEELGVEKPLVEHPQCSVLPGSSHTRCVFSVRWDMDSK